MSFVLQKHQHYVVDTVVAYQAKLAEIEGDIRLRAMSNDTGDVELSLLRRLKEECAATLYRYQNLKEAFKAVVGEQGVATEELPQPTFAESRSGT
jgi:predicted neuraminidase